MRNCFWLLLGCTASLSAAEPARVSYETQALPIFRKHCLSCHGPEKQESNFRVDRRSALLRGGDFGEPAIQPGKGGESHLIRLVRGTDPDFAMPPEGDRLTAAEIETLTAWIDQGAEMPLQPGESLALTTDHWSFQPLKKVAPPVNAAAWGENAVDAFVLRKLSEKQLSPSARAERSALIRRLYLVMLGLLPSPEEIRAFEQDDQPGAWPRLVEQVLASPHYGERWARHWLDVVRFAESAGFETNHERPTAFHYRDYVIRAFNEDRPWRDFVEDQLAGDSRGVDAATGFLVGGAWDRVKSPDPGLTAQQRQDELADMVNTTSTAFLGLTLGCARCHNHKFDPLLQEDYYALQAVFAGVQHGERELPLPSDSRIQTRLTELAARIDGLQRQLASHRSPPVTGRTIFLDDEDSSHVRLLAEKRGHGTNPNGTARGYRQDAGGVRRLPNVSGGRYTWWTNKPGQDVFAYRPGVAGRFQVWLSWGSGWNTHATDARYLLDRDGDPATTADQTPMVTVNQRLFGDGTGEIVSQPLWSGFRNAGVWDFAEQSVILLRGGEQGAAITADAIILREMSGQREPEPTPRLLPPVNARENVERFAPVAARWVRFVVEATNFYEPCLDELEIWTAGENPRNVALAANGSQAASSGDYPGASIHQLPHIYDGKYGNERSWISNEMGRGWVRIELPRVERIDRIVWQRDRNGKYADRLPTKYRIEVATEPDQWQLVAGSDWRAPFAAEPPESNVWESLGLSAEQAAQVGGIIEELNSLEQERNRLSVRPLAYAGQFMQPGPTHRLYRGEAMSPREVVSPDALTVLKSSLGSLNLALDAPEKDRREKLAEWLIDDRNPLTARVIVNRLWQHHFGRGIVATPSDFGKMGFAPTHPELLDWLAGELIRSDWSLKHIQRLILGSATWRQNSAPRAEALAVDAGAAWLWRFPPQRLEAEAIRDNILLVSGQLDTRMAGPGYLMVQPNDNYSRNWVAKDDFGPAEFRRMVYALRLRMVNDAVFGAFDCPDGGQIAPRRTTSTTPIQALNLFNSPFMLQQSQFLAERIARESGDDPAARTQRLFELTLSRQPTAAEQTAATNLIRQHGLPALCRAVLNANEFLFVP